MMKKKYGSLAAVLAATCLVCSCGQTGETADAQVNAVDLVADIATTQYFTAEAVNEADMETILMAGINAPSAMNGQPWHFSVITDGAVLQQISEDMSMGFGGGMPGGAMPEGMKLPEGMEKPEGMELPEGMKMPEGMKLPDDAGMPPAGFGDAGKGGLAKAGMADAPMAIIISCKDGSELDAGLACQNMSVTAQLLGYGTKIISSPTMALNGAKQAEYKELLGIPENQAAVAILLVGYEDTAVDTSADGYTGATERNPLDEVVTFVETQK